MQIFIAIILSVCIFFASHRWFEFCASKYKPSNIYTKICKNILTAIITLSFIGCSIIYFIDTKQTDMVVSLSYWHIALFFSSAIALALLGKYLTSNKLIFLLIFAICLLNTLLLPSEIDITNGMIPPLAEKIVLAFIWSVFASFYFVINGVDGLLTINSLSIYLGLVVITVIGVWPVTYSFYTATFIAIFLALSFFDRFPAKIRISKFQSQWIGFIIGWLGVLATIEGSGSCFVILSMYYIYETIIAIGKKISFRKQYKTLANNTFYSQVANVGIPPQQICGLISKINMILILLSCLQIYSPNQQTLMVVAFFTVFWIILKITSPDKSNSHFLLTSNLISMYKNTKKNKNSTTKDN